MHVVICSQAQIEALKNQIATDNNEKNKPEIEANKLLAQAQAQRNKAGEEREAEKNALREKLRARLTAKRLSRKATGNPNKKTEK